MSMLSLIRENTSPFFNDYRILLLPEWPNVLKSLEPYRFRFDYQNLSVPLARCVTLDELRYLSLPYFL